jgi:hypothetical protein
MSDAKPTEGERLRAEAERAIARRAKLPKKRRSETPMPPEVNRWLEWRAEQFRRVTATVGEWGKPIGQGKPPK